MSVTEFRQRAEDVFLGTYFVLSSCYGEEGVKQLYTMLLNQAQKPGLQLEAVLYAVKSLEVAIAENSYPATQHFIA